MLNRPAIVVAFVLLAAPTGTSAEDKCGIYPDEVSGISDCILRDAGDKPLWRGSLPRGTNQMIRFTFTEGHSLYTKVIDLTQWAGGKAAMRLRTFRRERNGQIVLTKQRRLAISATDMETIDKLGSSSGTWEHRIGSWDGDDIYVHCETLDMERATQTAYSYATVSISCNQPTKLMPFVSFVTGLIGLKPYADRQMF